MINCFRKRIAAVKSPAKARGKKITIKKVTETWCIEEKEEKGKKKGRKAADLEGEKKRRKGGEGEGEQEVKGGKKKRNSNLGEGSELIRYKNKLFKKKFNYLRVFLCLIVHVHCSGPEELLLLCPMLNPTLTMNIKQIYAKFIMKKNPNILFFRAIFFYFPAILLICLVYNLVYLLRRFLCYCSSLNFLWISPLATF